MADQNPARLPSCGNAVLLRKINQRLDYAAEFFGAPLGRVDISMPNELTRKVSQERLSLITRKAQLSSVYPMPQCLAPRLRLQTASRAEPCRASAYIRALRVCL